MVTHNATRTASAYIQTLEFVGIVPRSQRHHAILDFSVRLYHSETFCTIESDFDRFATVVVLLTIVQMLLGVAQVVGSFI